MSLTQYIRRLINKDNNDELPSYDEPPAYDDPPEYVDESNELPCKKYSKKSSKKSCKITNIINIINNIKSKKYNSGFLILDENSPSPSSIIKYLVENYSKTNDIMLYMIKNNKHNHTVKIGKEKVKLNNFQKNIFIIGPSNLNIYINNHVFNFSKYKCGIFSAIFLNEKGWNGNAIHNIGAFDKTFNFDNFIQLF